MHVRCVCLATYHEDPLPYDILGILKGACTVCLVEKYLGIESEVYYHR